VDRSTQARTKGGLVFSPRSGEKGGKLQSEWEHDDM